MDKIYNPIMVDKLIGCLIIDTTLANNEKYPLTIGDKKLNYADSDFCTLLHRMIATTLINMSNKGVKQATITDIIEYIKPYNTYYNLLVEESQNDPIGYLETISNPMICDIGNYEYYYGTVRKMSLLREMRDDGDCIEKYWSNDKSDEDNYSNLEEYTCEDIINDLEGRAIEKKRKYSRNKVKEEYVAGTDFLEYKELFKTEPLIGNSFQSEYLNGIFRGMFGFIIRSAKSGGGKSILSIGDLCKTTMTEYWDYETSCFVKNKSREGSSLFINTELELREELDIIIVSWVSGVPRNHITDGLYEDGEEERVEYANKIVLESGMYIVDDPEFTTKSLTETIKHYAINKKIKTCCFDYIANNGFVSKEISKETNVPQREDMVLLALTDRLKQVQRDTGISLISSTQTNGTEDNTEYPTESCLAGGKSQVRKTNGTMIMLPPTKKELEQTSMLFAKCTRGKFKCDIEINNVLHIIKGRNSKYPKNIKVFQYIDLGTGRTIDLFCTNKNNEPITVDKLKIEKN